METIAPFSLLNVSNADIEHIRRQTALLCHVRKSQIQDVYPCTPLQEGLLAMTAQDPGAYVAQFCYEIRDHVPSERLRAAWQQVAIDNPILRTRVVNVQGHGLLQVVVDEPLVWHERQIMDDSSSEDTASISMGLGTALIELTLFSTDIDGRRSLQLDIHHSLYDGWSFPLLLEELHRAYLGESSQSLQPITLLIAHQLRQNEADTNDFWRSQFKDIQGAHFPATNLLGISPTPDNFLNIAIPLPQASQEHDFTLTTMLKTAWSLVVASTTDKDEALFGLTVSGRQAPIDNIESMAGPAIATVPVRISIDWDQPASELLRAVQRQATDMIPFEQTGLQKIRRSSQDASLACKFQALLVIQPSKVDDNSQHSQGRSQELFIDTGNDTSKKEDNGSQNFQTYPLVIECHPGSDDIEARFDFDSAVISRDQVAAAAHSFERIFQKLVTPAQNESKLRSFVRSDDYYSDLEKIWSWNASLPEASELAIHEIIRQNSLDHPDDYALRAWDGEMTYKQLNDLTDRLASYLFYRAVAGTVVPLLFEKSIWFPIATLAVLKAGGAPVAVDVSQPTSRLQAILEQTDSAVVLTSALAKDLTLTLTRSRQVITIDSEVHHIDVPSLAPPAVDPATTLYVVFTSGSTGVPKGVMISHRNFASAIKYQQSFVGFGRSSRVLDFASYAFDVAWSNLLNTLTAGGCLCIPSAHERQNDLAGCIKRFDINFLDLTPSLARTLGREVLSQVDTMILGGEAAQPSDAFLAGTSTRVFNLYGPAECTPTITCSALDGREVHIGHGAGVCTWLVNPHNPDELVSIGSVGELWVEGPLVGNGYLGNIEQTNAAFVSDPPWLTEGIPAGLYRTAKPGRQGRLYRTGDLVRYKTDGTLVFVGRKDTQVKIRGQRIELGEIEQCINQVLAKILESTPTEVRSIVEIIKPQGLDSPVIVVFLCLSQDVNEAATNKYSSNRVDELILELSNRISEMLPSYMVPSTFIPIVELPITINGKTDIKALRAHAETVWLQDREKSVEVSDQAEELNETEMILQQIWMSVLNVPAGMASVTKPFMRMGGDSISAMQIVAECRLRSISTTVADILKSSTIRNLAACCQHTLDGATDVESADELESGKEIPFTLSPIQQNFFDAYPGGLNHYNQSFVLDFRQEVTSEILYAALHAIVSRHAMLRARFRRKPGAESYDQFVKKDASGSFAYCEHYVTSYAAFGKSAQWRQENLDLVEGPVFAGDFFHVPGVGNKLVLSAHHLVIDLVSWRIIWQELEDFVETGSLPLPPSTSFSKWAKRQARVAANISPITALPYSVPQSNLDYWGIDVKENVWSGVDFLEEAFDCQTTDKLFGSANDSMRTEPTDIILGALALSFAVAFPDRTLPAIWIEGHGREPLGDHVIDVSRTVGWFTTIYPLCLDLSAKDAMEHAVRLVKDVRTSVPGKGQQYFACRYHSDSGQEAFGDHGSVVEVQFNFTGRFQQLEKDEGLFKEESAVDEMSDFNLIQAAPMSRRSALIDITAGVEGDSLSVVFEVHQKMEHHSALQKWKTLFGEFLRDAAQSLSQAQTTLTCSDLSLLPLSYSQLDNLLHEKLPHLGLQSSNVKDIYPCAPLQEGMLLSQAKGSASYATFTVWDCTATGAGVVCTQRLSEAWKTVVRRHDILSTIFTSHPEGNGFLQLVLNDARIEINHLELSRGDESPAETLNRLDPPAFLVHNPAHSFTICKSPAGKVACRLDIGHSYYDAASAEILLEEIKVAYDCSKLPYAPSFRNVIEHVNKVSTTQRVAQWIELLKGAKPTEFPIQAVSVEERQDSHEDIPVLEDQGRAILDFCKANHITHSVFFQLVWALVLSQFTGLDDVCFGSLASGRDIAADGIAKIVGPVATMLVCRVNLRQAFSQVLSKTMEDSIRHFSIQHTSLAEIQHKLGFSDRKLFNTSLSIQSAQDEDSVELWSLSMEPCEGGDAHEHDLNLSIQVGTDKLEASLAFRQPQISCQLADEVRGVLSQAADFILNCHQSNDNIPMYQEFFRYNADIDENDAKSFWQSKFSGIKNSHFPQTSKAARQLPRANVKRIETHSFATKTTQSKYGVMVRATWSLLVARYLDSSESIFGILDTETPFKIPVRVQLDLEKTQQGHLHQIEDDIKATIPYQRTAIRNIQRYSGDAAQACCFQTMIRERNEDDPLSTAYFDNDDAMRPLVLIFESLESGRIQLEMRFDEHSLNKAQARRLLRQFETVWLQLADPKLREVPLSHVSLLTCEDLGQTWDWNSSVPKATNACFHDIVAVQARKYPALLAVDAWDGSMTYSELDEFSTKLAHVLVEKGVVPGDVIPICFEKSKWATIATIAVMKSGGICLLIDPSTQPEERVHALAERTNAKALLTSTSHEAMCGRINKVTIVVNEMTFKFPATRNTDSLPTISSADTLYIMFTSGSTGQPKGIMVSHTNACSAVTHQGQALGFSETTRTLDFASYAFDASWWNMFLTLSAGGCLCVPSAKERDNIAHCIDKYEISFVDLIPSVARYIEPSSVLAQLKTLVLAGEPALTSDAELGGEDTAVFNVYGPAECTPTATFSKMIPGESPSIGKGAGLCTWVVEANDHSRLAAIGTIGELCLEGPLVSQGYIKDPEKTASAFIQDPEWLVKGSDDGHQGRNGVVYRTGDLVKYNTNGTLSFVGRQDSQVKVRGQRLELGEVEHNVRQAIEEIISARVQVIADVTKLDEAGSKVLVAFVALDAASSSGSNDKGNFFKLVSKIVERLEATLQPSMVPQHFIPISFIPHTPSGKIDRRKLLADAPSQIRELSSARGVEAEKRPPITDSEQLLAATWSEVLQVPVESIAVNDTFFRLGGDSVGAMRLVMKAKQKGLLLTVREIFQQPVLENLASLVDEKISAEKTEQQ